MTLIELMVVITIIALASAAVAFGAGAISDAELKNAALKVVAAARFASARAVTRGHTTRLRFDLNSGTMAVEEAAGAMVIARQDDARTGENGQVIDPWAAAKSRLEDTFEPSLGESPFGPVLGRDDIPLARYQASPLGRNIQVERLVAMHMPDGKTTGEASLYFFPSGLASEAVVWLGSNGDRHLSVTVHALTGRARIEEGKVELVVRSESAFDEDASELRDPS